MTGQYRDRKGHDRTGQLYGKLCGETASEDQKDVFCCCCSSCSCAIKN